MREKAEKEAEEGKADKGKKKTDNKPKTLAEKQKSVSEEIAKRRNARVKGV